MNVNVHTTAKSVISTFSTAAPPSSSLPKTKAALRDAFCACAVRSASNRGACNHGKRTTSECQNGGRGLCARRVCACECVCMACSPPPPPPHIHIHTRVESSARIWRAESNQAMSATRQASGRNDRERQGRARPWLTNTDCSPSPKTQTKRFTTQTRKQNSSKKTK